MQTESWLRFISDKVRSQIATETVRKAQTWALAILGLTALGMAINTVVGDPGSTYLYITKVLFLGFFHLFMALGIYLPGILQKSEKPLSKILGIRDFVSLIFNAVVITAYAWIVFSVAHQVALRAEEMRASGFFVFTAWMNVLAAGFYLAGLVFYFVSIRFFPSALTKFLDRLGNRPLVFFLVHVVLFVFTAWTYGQVVEIGSSTFFDQFRLAGFFWISMASWLFYIGKLLDSSILPNLNDLEFEIASGKLNRAEDILSRYKQAFIARRLTAWMSRLQLELGKQSHEIARFLHEVVAVVSEAKPSEPQLVQMEDRYKKAQHIYKTLDGQFQRFLLNLSFFNLLEVEREKVEELRDQFSKELRHAKLELASVRKRMDDKLVSLKDSERIPVVSDEVPVEKVPVSR